MTTLIAVYNSEGLVGRCDAKCHDAEYPQCVCICGGANHGVGHDQAVENTLEMIERKMENLGLTKQLERFRKAHDLHGELNVSVSDLQPRLPGM